MSQKTILVVDDDPKIRALLRRCLEADGYRVDEASDLATFRSVLASCRPDLITLDLILGAEDGFDVVRDARRTLDVPIIMITGKDDVIDRIVGLELGADDYLTKPFHVREVLARVRAVLRRSEVTPASAPAADQGPAAVMLDGLTIDIDHMTLFARDGEARDLTTADFRLLAAFLDHPKRPLSRDLLMDLVGGLAWAPLDRTIDNQVARLRKKIERDAADPRLIRTVRGVGYMLTEPPLAVGHGAARTVASA